MTDVERPTADKDNGAPVEPSSHSLIPVSLCCCLILSLSCSPCFADLLGEINQVRQEHDLPKLATHSALVAAAKHHVRYLSQRGTVPRTAKEAHFEGTMPRTPNEWRTSNWHFINRAIVAGYIRLEDVYRIERNRMVAIPGGDDLVGEIVSIIPNGRASDRQVVRSWLGSKSHRADLLGNYKHVGYAVSRDGRFYVVDFGNQGGGIIQPIYRRKPHRLGYSELGRLEGYSIYFGDQHSHTSYSDGRQRPIDAYTYAKAVPKLDFFCLTDHLEQLDDAEWRDTMQVAWKANSQDFVAFPGVEWTTGRGHACLYWIGAKYRGWPRTVPSLYHALADAGAYGKFNHPCNPDSPDTTVFNHFEYFVVGDQVIHLLEVRKDYEETSYIYALRKGWHVAPDGSTDTHAANWGNRAGRLSWTGILARELTLDGIYEAVTSRHCFATRDRTCELRFYTEVGDKAAIMGDIIPGVGREIEFKVDVADNEPMGRIIFYENGTPTDSSYQTSASFRRVVDKPSFYFVKVYQKDGDRMWSAPIWVE